MIEIRRTDNQSSRLKEAYEELYTTSTTEHAKSYYLWILKHLKPRAGSTLLDVCCGTGKLAELARQSGVVASGTDFSFVALRQSTAPTAVADALSLPFASNSVDYVVCLGSLEHLVEMSMGVREMARVVKPGGEACILVPNTFGLLWTIRYAKWTGEIATDDQPLQRYGTRGEWHRLLTANGLNVTRVMGYELPPPISLKMWREYIFDPWMKLLPLALWRFIPVNIASMLVFFCQKP